MVSSIQIKKEITMDTILKKIIWLIIITPAIYLAIVWNKISNKIGTHFDLKDTPDKYGSKVQLWIGIGVIALISTLIYILTVHVYRGKYTAENKGRFLRICFTIAVFMSVVSISVISSSANEGGIKMPNIRFAFATIGFAWAIMGNYMYNIRPNHFVGFRNSWTLNNEEIWRKTHLLGSKVWFAGGLLIAIVCFFASKNIVIIIFIGVSFIIMLTPFIYSYRLYKKTKSS